ncbi:prepilin-type N-terminal cleavage/methylation domain-containing protein [Panacagrimonas perspica]|uniref:Prepilin-type N-terminal cleavage/methylation domain-containing protein n=1 Tax=Panacagrimonas perspica TaxID=381431 RepID=A0A4S3K852_9GAMM|nr:PilW family protein [Panacagrimonas perspica]TDU32072.1 prepilin-type N-terminal cleavage/methylation domain-containing protein [Panacagrimonas perspica]THD04399.1 hypothetical protein B1810_05175 [Panacagrimonas perspica]
MRPESKRQSGFTLIELLVSTTLGLLLLAGIATLFVSTNRSYRENDLIAGMQDQARFAMATISRDLTMAGYWGGMLGTGNLIPNFENTSTDDDDTSAVQGLLPAQDCGPPDIAWSFLVSSAVEFRNQDSATPITSQWRCLGNVRAGTDALAIRHVAGQTTASMALGESAVTLRPYHFYLQTNGTAGTMIRWGNKATDNPTAQPLAPNSFQRYYPRIYFVRDFSLTPGDGVPALCRKELCPSGYVADSNPELASCGAGAAGAAGFYSECIAEGVEDLQVVWGLDDPSDNDDIVDRYTATPTPDEVKTQARSVQIHLLVRSRRSDASYLDEKTYRLADKEPFIPSAVADAAGTPATQQTRHFFRRAYSTTVQLRNLGIQGGTGVK